MKIQSQRYNDFLEKAKVLSLTMDDFKSDTGINSFTYLESTLKTETRDIVDIVSEVVLLNQAGKNFLGLCPFHSEKTPSFTVSPEKQIFYCFGCGLGGDASSFSQILKDVKKFGLAATKEYLDRAREFREECDKKLYLARKVLENGTKL